MQWRAHFIGIDTVRNRRRVRAENHLPDPPFSGEGIPARSEARDSRSRSTLCEMTNAVQTVAKLFASLEERRGFFIDLDRLSRARIAPDAGRPALHRKGAETAQFDALAAGERFRDFQKYDRYDFFDVAMKKTGVFIRKPLHEFRFYHGPPQGRRTLFRRGVWQLRKYSREFSSLMVADRPCGVKTVLN